MKRNLDPTPSGSSSKNMTSKRPKSIQACSSCRRHKTRCEHEGSKCHRCKVLGIECTFGDADSFVSYASSSTTAFSSPESNWDRDQLQTDSVQLVPTMPTPIRSQSHSSGSESSFAVHPPTPSTTNDDHIALEDILPVPNPFPSGRDWSTTPLLAIQKLSTNSPLPVRSPGLDTSLSSIIPKDKIRYLLDIFDTRYSPWLNLSPKLQTSTPLLDLVRCTIASRHLDDIVRSDAVPRLHKLTQQVISQQMFNSVPSLDFIQSILIMALWAPVCGPDGCKDEERDARMLIGTAVNAALNLRLNEASSFAIKLRAGGLASASEIAVETDKARLWTSLSTIESALCLGTGRVPLSSRSDQDLTLIDPLAFPPPEHSIQGGDRNLSAFTIEQARDLRLGLIALLLNTIEQGLSLRYSQYTSLDTFLKETSEILSSMARIIHIISPLSVVMHHEPFWSQMLEVQFNGCILLILHHFLRQMRTFLTTEPSDSQTPWFRTQHNGSFIVLNMGRKAIFHAEATLISVLRLPRDVPLLLGTAPDHFFSLISFAASFIVISKISATQTFPGSRMGGGSDGLLAMTVERFNQIACTHDHAPARCAQLVAALIETCKKRLAIHYAEQQQQDGLAAANSLRSSAPTESPPQHHQQQHQAPHNHGYTSDYHLFPHASGVFQDDLDQGLNGAMDADVFQDVDFWASFMDNLNNDAPTIFVGPSSS